MAAHGIKSIVVPPAEWGGLTIDRRALASWKSGSVSLSPSEAFILSALIRAQGDPVHRTTIIAAIYNSDPDGGPLHAEEGLMVYISRTRKKLRDAPVEIKTKHGLGYYLAVRVAETV